MAISRQKKAADRAQLLRAVKRLALPVLLTIALAGVACAYAVARLTEQSRPDLALTLMPSLAPALAAKSDALIAANVRGDPGQLAEARAFALRSLRASPLNSAALRVIAATGPQNQAYWQRRIETALRVSRRDLGAQLLQIELDVARNDIPATLRHYDQALRVKPSVGATLYPILLAATDVPDVLPEIRRMVATGPEWLPGMVAWTLDNPDYQRRVARLVGAFPAGSDTLAPGYGQALVEAMVDRKELAPAFMVQQAYARRSAVRGFAGGFTYRPIDWTTADNYETGSDLVERPAPHVHFFAEQGARGVFLSRLAALPPGRYRLAFAVDKPADDSVGTLGLTLSCQTAREDRGFSASQVRLASGRFAQTFTIPPRTCPFQWVRFSVSSRQGSVAADLTRVAIDRVG
jgi:hypothetical protein